MLVPTLGSILQALLSGLPHPPKLVVVNAPHNPTGFLFKHEEFLEVVAACSMTGSYLLSDEMYRLLGACGC